MRNRGWTMPEDEARSFLQQIEDRIRSSEIECHHRDVLIRLRALIEEDLESGEGILPQAASDRIDTDQAA
jgi:hypothetical protein